MAANNALSVIDLFSGAGGLSLGAARAGFSVVGAVELDEKAYGAHQANFPGTRHFQRDIASLRGQDLLFELDLKVGQLAAVIGGPPCQGFSCIGKAKKNDSRNLLFGHFLRLVGELKPAFLVAENVPGILDKKYAKYLDTAFATIRKEYEVLPPVSINAKDYGAPTSRRRVFFIGYRKSDAASMTAENFKPPQGCETVLVKDALEGLPTKIRPEWQDEDDGWRVVRAVGTGFFGDRLHGHIPAGVGNARALERLSKEKRASGCLGTIHSKKVARRYGKIKTGRRDPVSKSHRLDLGGFCPTLRAGTGKDRGRFQAVRPLHPVENRVITPREAARLQGFPDWFMFSPEKWHSFRQIGSSVSPIVAERILGVIRSVLFD